MSNELCNEMGESSKRNTDAVAKVNEPSFTDIVIVLVSLVVLISSSVFFFGDSSSQGGNQIALTVVAVVVGLIAVKNGFYWHDIEKSIISSVSTALMAMLIMLSVGALIGSWILSGTVPAMIFYGGQLLNPDYFYAATCLICALSALCTGSSWTVAGTIGIGLIGTGAGLGMSLDITAGAVISGAYFGDKMSPLSDTTNLAPAVVGVDLFAHIRNMMWTTIPSISIALLMFLLIGGREGANAVAQLEALNGSLNDAFNINPWMLVPLAVVLILATKKVPALPTIIAGTAVGSVFALVFQPQAVLNFVGDTSLPTPIALVKGAWTVLSNGYVSTTGHPDVDTLLSRGGMSSMLNTVWLIVSAMICGGLMEKAGILSKLVHYLVATSASSASLIVKTIVTCVGVNAIAADQYIAIVFPGRMYKEAYARRGMEAKTLSRVLEDSGTITSPLIPWNTCGAFMAGTLGVATLSYLPYCFFNLVNPVISVAFAYLGVAMASTYRVIEDCDKQPTTNMSKV